MAKKTSPSGDERVRITLDLSPAGYNRLQKLTSATNASAATVLRQALQLFEFVVEKNSEGYRFKTVSKSGEESEIAFLGYSD